MTAMEAQSCSTLQANTSSPSFKAKQGTHVYPWNSYVSASTRSDALPPNDKTNLQQSIIDIIIFTGPRLFSSIKELAESGSRVPLTHSRVRGYSLSLSLFLPTSKQSNISVSHLLLLLLLRVLLLGFPDSPILSIAVPIFELFWVLSLF